MFYQIHSFYKSVVFQEFWQICPCCHVMWYITPINWSHLHFHSRLVEPFSRHPLMLFIYLFSCNILWVQCKQTKSISASLIVPYYRERNDNSGRDWNKTVLGNQIWSIQRNWQHRAHKMEKNKTNTQYWITPPHASTYKFDNDNDIFTSY
jgi:hypothetical protein